MGECATCTICTTPGLYVWSNEDDSDIDDEEEEEEEEGGGEGGKGSARGRGGGPAASGHLGAPPLDPPCPRPATLKLLLGPHLAAYLHYEQLLPIVPPQLDMQVGVGPGLYGNGGKTQHYLESIIQGAGARGLIAA